jgi:hypothetical protein
MVEISTNAFRDIFSAGVCSCVSPSTQGPHGQYSFSDDESAIVVGSVKTTETVAASRQAEESSRSNEPASREHAEEESSRSSEAVFFRVPTYLRIGIDNSTRDCNDDEEFEVTVDTFAHGHTQKIEPRRKRSVGSNVNKVWRTVRQNTLYFKRNSSTNKRSALTERTGTFGIRMPKLESWGTSGSF